MCGIEHRPIIGIDGTAQHDGVDDEPRRAVRLDRVRSFPAVVETSVLAAAQCVCP